MTANLLKIDEENRLRSLDLTSFIVEAPAGAGKTELLTQRYLRLLQTVNEPEEIIAITFTNKAAAEMRLRILDSLINAANQTPPDKPHKNITYQLSLQALQHAQDKGWGLIENPSRLRIFTIDSLCAHLARQMPLMSRFGAQPRITDNAEALYAQAASQTLALLENNEHGSVVKTALRYVDNNADQLTQLLINMLAKRDQWLHQAQHEVNTKQLQNTLRYLIEQQLQATVDALPATLQGLLMPIANFAASNLPCDANVALLIDWETPISAKLEAIAMWRALADLLLTATGEPRKEGGLNVKFGFPPTDEGKAQKMALAEIMATIGDVSALHRTRALPNLSNDEASWQIITTLSKLLNLAVAQLWLVFQHAGEVDFVEISQRATLALTDNFGEPTDLALKLDYQIKHLLVDEFQDTSPNQIALLEQLTLGWQAGDGRTLFCVGDPMQSIYRFRKANVAQFIHASKHGIGHIRFEKLQLYRNNRSCPPIVDWINDTFVHLFPEFDDETQGAIHYRAFIAASSIADSNKHVMQVNIHVPSGGIEIHPIVKLNNETNNNAQQREAEAIIRIIQHEQTENPGKKIAILVRAKKHLAPLVTKLRREHKDIKFQAVEIEALEGRQIVQDLLALTHALHHRADRVHWLAILRAPWCGLSLHDLYALAGSNHHATIWCLMQNDGIVNQLSADGQARLEHVREIFAEAFATQGRKNVSRWIRGIWLMLNGTACLWELSDIVDVQAFFACLDNLDRSNQFSPERMDTEITKLFATPDSQGETLQMMTIHKSKGLEFNTVILPGLGAKIGGNNSEKPLVLWEEVSVEDQPELLAAPYIPKSARDKNHDKDSVNVYDYLETLENERDANEDARVLYVAATRAERKLHLVGIAIQSAKGEIKPTKNTYLDLLWSAVSHKFEATEFVENTETIEDDIANFTPSLVRLKQVQIPSVLQLDKTTSAAPNKLQTKQSLPLPTLNLAADAGSSLNLAADSGTLAHCYMEMIANTGLEHWPASRINACFQAMQFWLLQRGYAINEVEKQVPHIIATLKQTITSPQCAWMLAPRPSLQAEISITALGENNTLQEHRIDLTFIEEDVRWIIDYKLAAANENIEMAAKLHKPQLAHYARLFLHENLPIKTAVFFLNLGKLVLV
jgi:ATP-dependent helicase/nuclease subunit A